jgi:alpha-beta hydrolase superfamily lysophospholipase
VFQVTAGSPHNEEFKNFMGNAQQPTRRSVIGSLLRSIVLMAAGAVASLVVVAVVFLNSKPELSTWHRAQLTSEFTDGSAISSLADYLQLEQRLFEELQEKVSAQLTAAEKTLFNRYNPKSLSDPNQWQRNWNRTFELPANNPAFAVILLHGYSDSPYSLRSLGAALNAEGGHVLGLRLPGHGTVPSSLRSASWQDMAAAVRLAVADLAHRFPAKPLFMAGYSNGAALVIEYTLEAITNTDLQRPTGLILISPEIAITPAAALARWQALVGRIAGLDKLAWSAILPEYDPFKYNSFAINAGVQARDITLHMHDQIRQLSAQGLLGKMPPVLAFQSAVDATVTARAVVTGLFDLLEPPGHRLVVFDINRMFEAEGLIRRPPVLETLLYGPVKDYDVVLLTNQSPDSREVVLIERRTGSQSLTTLEPGLAWPSQVYSLSHIALPFAQDDPAYGDDAKGENPGLKLGLLALRGETGVTEVPASAMTRLHWNPFHAVLLDQVRLFISRHAQVAGN